MFPLSSMSIKRPGVPTIISTPYLIYWIIVLISVPPYTATFLYSSSCFNKLNSLLTYIASSLVGKTTKIKGF